MKDLCSVLPSVVSEISTALENISLRDKDEMKYAVGNSVKKIYAWKAHLLRSSNEDQARPHVLQSLNQESALLVLNWAMKFLPRKFCESQTDWFSKRKISRHLTVATGKNKYNYNYNFI